MRPPGWFDTVVRAAFLALLGFALVAVPCALLGVFRPWLVLPLSLAAAVGLWRAWRGPASEGERARRAASGPAVAVVLVALAMTGLNARNSAQHLVVDSDAGIYTVTGKYLADEGELLVDSSPEAFGDDPYLKYEGAGFYPTGPDRTMHPQFLHLLPMTLAAGEWVGGLPLMLRLNALLGGLAVLLFFGFASRLLPPGWAAVAATALAVNFPQAYFARDTYSEVLGQALLFGALALLWDARESGDPVRRGLVAGAAFGAGCLVRVDAFVYLAPLVLWLGYELWRLPSRATLAERARVRRLVPAVLVSAFAVAALGLLDGRLYSPYYLRDLGAQLRLIGLGITAALAVAVGGLFLRRPASSWLVRVRPHLRAVALAAAGVVAVLAAYAWFVRPEVEVVRQVRPPEFVRAVEGLQRREGVPVDGLRTYAEQSMRWLSWYLGPVALATGVAGTCVAVHRLVVGRAERWLLFLLVFGTTTAYYVYDPSISPIHVFAARRFVPVAFPGLLLLAALACSLLWRARGAVRAVAPVVALLVVAVPAVRYARELATVRVQVPMLGAIDMTCAALPGDAAVAMTQDARLALGVTVETFCDVPVAGVPGAPDAAYYDELAAKVRAGGRRLFVLAANADSLPDSLGPAEVVYEVGATRLDPSLTKPARDRSKDPRRLYLVPVGS